MKSLAIQALESTINTCLAMDAATIKRLKSLQNKIVKIVINDWDIVLYIIPAEQGINLYPEIAGNADTTISANLSALFQVGYARGDSTALFKHQVNISGDTELGKQLREIMTSLDIDWEEQLAKYIGDIAAYKVSGVMRGLRRIVRNSATLLSENSHEFLQVESGLLPTNSEVAEFIDQVADLRNAVERAAARVDHLIAARKST